MNLEEYKIYWRQNKETLHVANVQNIDKTKFDQDTFNFLTIWGLPPDAAPFVSFSEFSDEKFLSVNDFFGLDWSELDSYLVFGTNGSGDPICVDIKMLGEIVYLNHDNDFERIYINKSIYKFAFTLIRYHQFISSLLDYSNTDYRSVKFTDQSFEELKNDFENIDNTCFAYNSFWTSELDALLSERDND